MFLLLLACRYNITIKYNNQLIFLIGRKNMLDIIENNLLEIRKLCLQFNVRKLELFGSALNEGFDRKSSDIDFLVEFQELQPGQYANAYFGLLEALTKVFGRDIDMVMTKAIKNPYFLQKINQNRKVLYAA